MTRYWTAADPEPGGVRAVVDPNGCTWELTDEDGDGFESWHQRLLTCMRWPDGTETGAVLGGSVGNEWADMFDELPEGSAVREAAPHEERIVVIRWETIPWPEEAEAT